MRTIAILLALLHKVTAIVLRLVGDPEWRSLVRIHERFRLSEDAS